MCVMDSMSKRKWVDWIGFHGCGLDSPTIAPWMLEILRIWKLPAMLPESKVRAWELPARFW